MNTRTDLTCWILQDHPSAGSYPLSVTGSRNYGDHTRMLLQLQSCQFLVRRNLTVTSERGGKCLIHSTSELSTQIATLVA
jgi:hypothetical protein